MFADRLAVTVDENPAPSMNFAERSTSLWRKKWNVSSTGCGQAVERSRGFYATRVTSSDVTNWAFDQFGGSVGDAHVAVR
jgi:hypothetical protein